MQHKVARKAFDQETSISKAASVGTWLYLKNGTKTRWPPAKKTLQKNYDKYQSPPPKNILTDHYQNLRW